VGGDAADFNRFAIVRERGTVEFREWLSTPARGARPPYLLQLDQLAAFIEGKAHTLPGFQEALAVQETIEGMLK
jgi:hypothetical protein